MLFRSVKGDAVGPAAQRLFGGADKIGMRHGFAVARVAQRGHVVDVDAEAEFMSHAGIVAF